jgi:hypothetical protein
MTMLPLRVAVWNFYPADFRDLALRLEKGGPVRFSYQTADELSSVHERITSILSFSRREIHLTDPHLDERLLGAHLDMLMGYLTCWPLS